MNTSLHRQHRTHRAFTLIELLVVIAIIAILAAILFPVFAAVREQSRQANTMSNLHSVYLGARLFYEDEGRYPSTLFGYVEKYDNTLDPPYRPALPADSNITPMDKAIETFRTSSSTINHGYLFHDQIKDYITFTNDDSLENGHRIGLKDVTAVEYPARLGGGQVNWSNGTTGSGCAVTYGDLDLPNPSASYAGQAKLFYKADSMDIGPKLDPNGNVVRAGGQIVYELHYSPDWTHRLGAECDVPNPGDPPSSAIVTQLKYRNPPTERTIITYITHHVAFAGSSKVIILLLSGTARKMDAKDAYNQLPLTYVNGQ